MLQSVLAQAATEPTLIQQEIVFVVLLLMISGVAIFVRKVRVPYTVALVVVGLILAVLPTEGLVNLPIGIGTPFTGGSSDEVTSELILALLVPPLIFEAALRLNLKTLRKEWLPILLLAVPGVLISALLVGSGVSFALGIPIALAVAFGALISATDPVAVIAFFRSLGVDKRLSILVEGESLINDGVAVVLFTMALAAAGSAAAQPTVMAGLVEFIRVAGGGILVGLLAGFLAAQIISRLDDRLVETTLTMALAVGSFVGAETLHVSGILAVLTAGLVIGSLDLDRLGPTTRITLYNFWDLLGFIANSAVFLILGLQINLTRLSRNLDAVFVAVVAILVSRAIVVYSMTWISSRVSNPIPMRYRHVMFWGGLRGAISLALALSLTGPGSEELQFMTFGVVLFTLLVQGLTIEPLIKRLGLSNLTRTAEQQHTLARLMMLRASRRELDALRNDGLVAQPTWQAVGDMTEEDMQELLHDHPELERTILVETRQDLLRAKRNALAEALHRGNISEEVYHDELSQLDRQIMVWERFDEFAGRNRRTTDAAGQNAPS
ncbi:MAG: Na+/H+ antiporter [Anaerolineae bacterium]|nr:Na+/H+ antiporter [Anaerolineae bacterium]MCB0256600.1 Na+/H+ antiporter [Anaerolineae bacterium]